MLSKQSRERGSPEMCDVDMHQVDDVCGASEAGTTGKGRVIGQWRGCEVWGRVATLSEQN